MPSVLFLAPARCAPWARQSEAGIRRNASQQEEFHITKPIDPKVRVNEGIRARQVRVIDEAGEQLGIMSPEDAVREAVERGYDLVEVAPTANPPVCRIMDYGKYTYQQNKRSREAKKHQHTIVVKEVKYRPKIDDHDFDYKTQHVREFLMEGNKVKVTVTFRGREAAHPEFGHAIMDRVLEATKDISTNQADTKGGPRDSRSIALILTPTKQAQILAAAAAKNQAKAAAAAAAAAAQHQPAQPTPSQATPTQTPPPQAQATPQS
jgi:translation initiation factor IF-3